MDDVDRTLLAFSLAVSTATAVVYVLSAEMTLTRRAAAALIWLYLAPVTYVLTVLFIRHVLAIATNWQR